MTDNNTIWVAKKVEEEYISRVLRSGWIADSYEVIVTDDDIKTFDSAEELQSALDFLEERNNDSFDPSNTASVEEMKEMNQETGIRSGKGSGFFSRVFLKSGGDSDAAKNMKEDIEENSDFYNSLAIEPDEKD